MTLSPVDSAALRDLVHRYAADVDDREFDAVASLFTDTAELSVPDPPTALRPVHRHRGQRGILEALGTLAGTARTEHAIVGEVYDDGPDPETARGRIACVAHHWVRHGEQVNDVVWHLCYDDEYRRTDAGWRISRRMLTINAIEKRPVHQLRPRDQ